MFEVAPVAIRRLGADVIVINAEPNGRNINDRCGATHTASLVGRRGRHTAPISDWRSTATAIA